MTTTLQPQFEKYTDGLLPAIVQDQETGVVLMLGFMNEEAWTRTQQLEKVTFFSRSKNRLWTKGEESGNWLYFKSAALDCDGDTLLLKASPAGPVCHTGTDTCWGEENKPQNFLFALEKVIQQRRLEGDESSYVHKLFGQGINKIAQKVGEEAVELLIEAKDVNQQLFLGEAADLLFHYLILLQAKGSSLTEVIQVLQERHKK